MVLGGYWLFYGHSSQLPVLITPFSLHDLMSQDNSRLFITLLYSLMGMEMIAVHAGDVDNPQKNYPRVLLISAGIILATVIPASLAIALVIPEKAISLTTGVVEAFTIFLHAFHLEWVIPLITLAIVIGSFGIFLTWMLTATRYLLVAAQDELLPLFLRKTNRAGMPFNQLILQGLIFVVFSSVFVFMPSVNSAFWFLSAAAAQFALLYYVILFVSALHLRYKYPAIKRPFQVGKKPWLLWFLCGMASITCVLTFCFGFLPPPEIKQNQVIR